MEVTLVVVGGKANAPEVRISLPTVIGRGQECNLRLPQPLVSRRHCELFERNGRLCVRDLGSMNGTYVGSDRISEAELPYEGLLTVGAVTFRALYKSSIATSQGDTTHHDVDVETKSNVEVPQSIEGFDPLKPVEVEEFKKSRDDHNDLTQPAPSPAKADESTMDALADVGLPPVVGKASKDAARTD
jgi:predicted component of type VI protein secretion system